MSTAENKSSFQQLLGDLDTLTKALPQPQAADDENKPAVAAEGEEGEAEGGEGGEMAKSFKVTLADGTEIEAQDGTELVKSLFERVDGQEDMMVKALGGTLELVKAQGAQLKAQGDLIKSLQDTVAKLGNQGAGRKTLVNVHEQVNSLTKSLPQQGQQGQSPQDFMAKSMAAFEANKISGQELNTIDVSLRMGAPIDPSLLAKVG
jgi:hypothetical protein